MGQGLEQPSIFSCLNDEVHAARDGGRRMLVTCSREIPMVDPLLLFAGARGQERVLWEHKSADLSMAAAGVAQRLHGSGKERFKQIDSAWRGTRAQSLSDAVEGIRLPIAFGGFAFEGGLQRDPVWQPYGDTLFIVPRLVVISRAGRSWLTVQAVARPAGVADEIDAISERVLDVLTSADPLTPTDDGRPSSMREDAHADSWKEAVGAITKEIDSGSVEKVVLARQLHLRAQKPLEAELAIRRLRKRYSDCVLFAFADRESCFLGATPEELIRMDGDVARATCLAGSAPRGADHEGDEAMGRSLLANAKERHEHEIVVSALREALAPLTSELQISEDPSLLRMPTVQHLATSVAGVVRDGRSILELVDLLHPTPAVGGMPEDAALTLIRRYEGFDRGWYAGPIGWLDGGDGGEFAVAIRSALVVGREASLYTGCGIVAGSDPESEYDESLLKLGPMLWALEGT